MDLVKEKTRIEQITTHTHAHTYTIEKNYKKNPTFPNFPFFFFAMRKKTENIPVSPSSIPSFSLKPIIIIIHYSTSRYYLRYTPFVRENESLAPILVNQE